MRIYGNRLLKTLPGQQTRPTTGKVRTALFNIWQGKITGCRWLDLCAGNGTLGAEALCRGAQTVAGIEQSGKVCAILRDNWQKVARPEQQWQVIRGSVLGQIPKLPARPFDRIYFDPPYQGQLYESVLTLIAQRKLLAAAGVMAVEYEARCWQPLSQVGDLICVREKHYGRSSLAFYAWSI